MDSTAKSLEKETRKWMEKLKKELGSGIEALMEGAKDAAVSEALRNMQAYIDDTKHFIEKKDFMRAFESIIYAWGIYETLKRTKLIK